MTLLDLWHRYTLIDPTTGLLRRYADLYTMRRLMRRPYALGRYLVEAHRDWSHDRSDAVLDELRESCDNVQRSDNELLTLYLRHAPRLAAVVRSGTWPDYQEDLDHFPEVIEKIETELRIKTKS